MSEETTQDKKALDDITPAFDENLMRFYCFIYMVYILICGVYFVY